MLGLAAAAAGSCRGARRRRRALAVRGRSRAAVDVLLAAGVLAMLGGLAAPARLFLRVARSRRIGVREGPVAHVALGLAFLLQAAALGLAAAAGGIDGRRAAVAGVVLLGVGWAVGVVLGHLGKLISLSGWGSWPLGRDRRGGALPARGLATGEAGGDRGEDDQPDVTSLANVCSRRGTGAVLSDVCRHATLSAERVKSPTPQAKHLPPPSTTGPS
jgi:hypothetical protein